MTTIPIDLEVPRFHDWLDEAATREPGRPPSRCKGALYRVDALHREIPWDSPWWLDDPASSAEGEPGTKVPVALFKCRVGGGTIVLSAPLDPNTGKRYLRRRNSHSAASFEPGEAVGPAPLAATA